MPVLSCSRDVNKVQKEQYIVAQVLTQNPVIAKVRDGRLHFKNNLNTWRFIGIVKGSAR